MSFLCQAKPFLTKHSTTVLECTKTTFKKNPAYKVLLQDSIFFPEGGGQIDNDTNIIYVSRENDKAFHYTDKPLEVGNQVECQIDWNRRFDHMQQHTGQHLLSAILEQEYGHNTVSWELGSQYCNVELDGKQELTGHVISELEQKINYLIRASVPVNVHLYTREEALSNIDTFKTRGLPLDVCEPIRVIEIEGIDFNMCCGTHLTNLSQIQLIKLLYTEKARGCQKLYFIAGNRAIEKFSRCYDNERKLNKLLGCTSDEHCYRVDQCRKNEKSLEKEKNILLKEMAQLQACVLDAKLKKDKLVYHYNEQGDNNYATNLLKNINLEDSSILVVGCGPVKGPCVIAIKASDDFFKENESKILDKLGAKGKSRNGQLFAKCDNLKNVDSLIADLKSLSL